VINHLDEWDKGVKSVILVKLVKETPAGGSFESVLHIKAEEAAIRKRLKANTGSACRSFDTGFFFFNKALDMPKCAAAASATRAMALQ
jgi:hypothetical protein